MRRTPTLLAVSVIVGGFIAATLCTILGVWIVTMGGRMEDMLRQVQATGQRLEKVEERARDDRAQLKEILVYLRECTTPSPVPPAVPVDEGDRVHECFNEGQARTGQAVGSINDVTLAAFECQRAGAPDLKVCVQRRLSP